MEIKITEFVEKYLLTGHASDFSCSQFERGDYAGKGSYQHAVETTEDFSVVTAENRPQLEKFFKSFGAWDIEEIQAWSDAELNGVCLQLIASDYKEFHSSTVCEGNGYYCDASQSVDGEYYYTFSE